MKWFGVDSDTPNDPRIRALLLHELSQPGGSMRHARAGIGGLFLVWCYIADHGAGVPGHGVDSAGRPLPLQEMADACYFESVEALRGLLDFCATRNHILADAWQHQGVVILPAMCKRADEYAKKLLRKAGKRVNPPLVSGDSPRNLGKRGHAPDSPIGTVDPVGLVQAPVDHIQQQATQRESPRATGTSGPVPIVSTQHRTHAACGPAGACVPGFLHQQFCDRLAGACDDADAQLRARYREVFDKLDPKAVVAQPVKFWESHFEVFIRDQFPTAVQAGPALDRRVAARGPRHTVADVDKYAGVTLRDDDAE